MEYVRSVFSLVAIGLGLTGLILVLATELASLLNQLHLSDGLVPVEISQFTIFREYMSTILSSK